MTTGIFPNGPTKYLGNSVPIVGIVYRNRAPTGADLFQPETGKYYPTGCFWNVTKNPTTGVFGDLWYLSKIVANVSYWVQVASDSTSVIQIDTPSGNAVPAAGVINFLNGTGMTISASGNDITFNSLGGGVSWVNVTGTSQAMSVGKGYIANNAGLVTFSLPDTANFGDFYIICGLGAGGWTISQNAGQSIILGKVTSTVGVGGSISSSLPSDTIELVCVVANTTFKAIGYSGALSYVGM